MNGIQHPWTNPQYDQATFEQRMREERIKRICEKYQCSQEDACRFIDLREEGRSVYESAVMAGIADPNS